MLCDWISGLSALLGSVECRDGFGVWPDLLALGVAVSAVAVLLLRGGAGLRGLASVLALTLAAGLLALAAHQPRIVEPADPAARQGGLLVVLVDVSESVWRSPGPARQALERLAGRVEEMVADLDPEAGWQGAVLQFADGVRELGAPQPMRRLPGMVRALRPAIEGDASRGAAGLARALAMIRDAGGRGAVLLMSDGHFAEGLPESALRAAQAAGVPVHVLATGSAAPGAGLVAADLGPEQQVGHEAVIRATVLGGGELTATRGDVTATRTVPDSDRLRPVRLGTRFEARGLRHVRLRFAGDGGEQARALYTLVRGPARVLAFGRAPWLDGLDPASWIVERADPAAPPDPARYDLVVIDGLVPADFPAGYDRALLKAVRRTGLFLVNGGLRGSVESPQRIADWNESALSPVLPVDSDPRKFIADPPRRDVVIMIDVSGSMSKSLPVARAVAERVLDQLRPKDTVAILPFSDRTEPGFSRRAATPAALAEARGFLKRLQADGGTAPDSTLRAAAGLVSNYCAYFFISDAGFEPPRTSPQCFTTAVSTEGQPFPGGVADWGEEILLHGGRGIASLKLEYFEPEERTRFYRPGRFRPRPVEGTALLVGRDVDGIATAFPRIDAEVMSLHASAPPDPVLAFRRDPAHPGVATAVFLGPVPEAAPADEVAALLDRLVGWNAQDRYDIRLRQTGNRLGVDVVVLAGGEGPAATGLSGSIRLDDGRNLGLAFRPVGPPGRFRAELTLPAMERAAAGRFVLDEPGQPPQVIPIDLAPGGARGPGGGETFDFGVDAAVLETIAARSGGVNLARAAPATDRIAARDRYVYFQSWAIAMAVTLLAAALWISGRKG